MNIDVAVIMGSKSDAPIMQKSVEFLRKMGIGCEVSVVSAHRTPERMFDFAKTAKDRGIKVIIAGAGGAAHLPGMVASLTTLPVIGVPILSSNSIEGIDSLLSIVQMPGGIPVATMAVDGAKNAGIFALRVLAISDEKLQEKLVEFDKTLKQAVADQLEDDMFDSGFDR